MTWQVDSNRSYLFFLLTLPEVFYRLFYWTLHRKFPRYAGISFFHCFTCASHCSQNDYRASPRRRDSIYMCLDSLPAALRDVSNYQSVPRTPENQAKPLARASLGSAPGQPRPRLKTPCSSCSPHRKELLRDRQTGVKRGRRQTPS